MQRLIANFSGRAHRRTWNGRKWLVAPVSMLVPGVLAGSKGPLLYGKERVARDPKEWDLMPLTLGHPFGGDSAHEEGVYDRQGLGVVRNAYFSGGKLRAEAWFDEERTKRLSPDVHDRLERGEPIEVSTGLFTTERAASPGSTWNGRAYDRIVIDYRPDHLAILPDQRGACSLDDGCGVHVSNQESEMVHNCECNDPTFNLANPLAGLRGVEGLPMPSTAQAEPTLNVEQNPEHRGVLPLPSTASPPRAKATVQNKQGARQAAGRGIGSIDHDGGMIVG